MGFGEHFLLIWTNDVLAHAINIAFFFIKSPGLSVYIAMGKWVSLSPVVMGPRTAWAVRRENLSCAAGVAEATHHHVCLGSIIQFCLWF